MHHQTSLLFFETSCMPKHSEKGKCNPFLFNTYGWTCFLNPWENSSEALTFPNFRINNPFFSIKPTHKTLHSTVFKNPPTEPTRGGFDKITQIFHIFSFQPWASCLASWRFFLEHCKCPFVCFSSWRPEVMERPELIKIFSGEKFDDLFGLTSMWFWPQVESEVVSIPRDFFSSLSQELQVGYRMVFVVWMMRECSSNGWLKQPFPTLSACCFTVSSVLVSHEYSCPNNGIDRDYYEWNRNPGVGVHPY